MKRILSPAALALCLATGLAACSSTPQLADAERLALYEAHAGEAVPRLRMFGRLTGWTPLGDSALVVWTRPNEAFLLDLAPCPDVPFATSISISHFTSMVTAGFDWVTPRGVGYATAGHGPCRITRIRPLDTRALKRSREEMRQAEAQPRPDAPDGEAAAD